VKRAQEEGGGGILFDVGFRRMTEEVDGGRADDEEKAS